MTYLEANYKYSQLSSKAKKIFEQLILQRPVWRPQLTLGMDSKDFSSISQLTLFVFLTSTLEYIIARRWSNVAKVRINDAIHSLSAALITVLPRFLVTSLDAAAYKFVFEALYEVPDVQDDDSLPILTPIWIFLLTDFGYYWFHRAAHEINILWSAHQVHHSSEDFNILVSLRQSVLQQFFSSLFYAPLAVFGIRPAIFEWHLWFSCFYQIWTHTEVVDNLGPLEYIFVTPSHHRVHHGGILIIWDRAFGTFNEEIKENPPVYGLVVERTSHWNPLLTQVMPTLFEYNVHIYYCITFIFLLCCIKISHFLHLKNAFFETKGVSNKFRLFVNGPSWSPGKQRLGDGDYEEVEHPVVKYDKTLPTFFALYVALHFTLLLLIYCKHLEVCQRCSVFQTIAVASYLLFSLTTFGFLFDHKCIGPELEEIRCIAFFFLDLFINKQHPEMKKSGNKETSVILYLMYGLSFALWIFVEIMDIDWTGREKKTSKNAKIDNAKYQTDENGNILMPERKQDALKKNAE
ncbi:alkylglycerol monooxygenase-like isoform X2 [Xenia sp. Carnegie-2017]|uniref:alkylglycerol monooxygenase-like isoform X2 n=1 Tax=Xenia sp. Carnegie-2017 TaxID=2897299 RepID=UPI001F04CB31|nr:alkylglycerol monooxygenase-like isoform X2 [Xenia sp. Carnegie-2017]